MKFEKKIKKTLVAPNSFKECADSVTISEKITKYLLDIPKVELDIKPISDGGDGFLKVTEYHFGGDVLEYSVSTAYDDSIISCPVIYVPESKILFVESANILGLKVVPPNLRNPHKLSSKGLGDLLIKIRDEVIKGKLIIEKIYIGIGGTATIDMGLGMMSVLGLNLLDEKGDSLTVLPIHYKQVNQIEWKKIVLPFEIIPVIDVLNPLTGKNSGITFFGKQKGATEEQLIEIESGFNNIINLLKHKQLIRSVEFLSGAGGGIPSAFQIFYNSYCQTSYEFILNSLGLSDRLRNYDYLITGEGAFDKQTLYGKGAGLLVSYYSNRVKKIFLVCGKIDDLIKENLPKNVFQLELIKYFSSEEESLKNYEIGIQKACAEIKEQLKF